MPISFASLARFTSEPYPRSNKQFYNCNSDSHKNFKKVITLTNSCSILIFWCYRGLTEFGVSNGADIICVSCSFHKRIEMRFQTNLAWTNMQIMQSRYDLRRSSIPPQKPSPLLSTLQSSINVSKSNVRVPGVSMNRLRGAIIVAKCDTSSYFIKFAAIHMS